MATNWLDRAIAFTSPKWAADRMRARLALDLTKRNYEGAGVGRRTQGWKRPSSDPNTAVSGQTLQRLRDAARDLTRNQPFAASAIETIVDSTVSWGIQAATEHEGWRQWSESTDCDADGRTNLVGLQELALAAVVESGEVLIRRRWRRLEDGFALPFQLQILEADHLDTSVDTTIGTARVGVVPGNRAIQGVEFDLLGRRVAYWIFPQHPGSGAITSGLIGTSIRVPASDIQHLYWRRRPGQVRGATWFAPVLMKFKDFDDLDDATLMKQKVAACLAVLTTDTDGTAEALGTTDADTPDIDTLSPGMIANIKAGRSIEVVQPPSVSDYDPYVRTQLRAIAAGIGVTYEDLTGDYTNLPFSAARMSRLRFYAKVYRWQDRLLIQQFLAPVWEWAMEAAALAGQPVADTPEWVTPTMPMIEPDKEGLAFQRNVRSGAETLSGAIRGLGYNPKRHLEQLAEDFTLLDQLGLKLDSDPRYMTQAGQAQSIKDPGANNAG